MPWSMRDKTAIVGIGETEYTRWGRIQRSEFQLACEAVLKAIEDAGLTVNDVDGFTTYSMDRNMPVDIARAIGVPRLRFSNLFTGGGVVYPRLYRGFGVVCHLLVDSLAVR